MSLSKLMQLEADMKKCFRCSLCKMVPLPTVLDSRYSNGCPANRELHFHGYSGSGKSIAGLSLIEGRIEVDQALAEIAFSCTACGLCDVSCKFIMEAERHQINMALREHLVDEGFGPSSPPTDDRESRRARASRRNAPGLGFELGRRSGREGGPGGIGARPPVCGLRCETESPMPLPSSGSWLF